MTKEGEVQAKKSQKTKVGIWFYIALFIGMMMIETSVTLYVAPSIWSITETSIYWIIFISLLAVFGVKISISILQPMMKKKEVADEKEKKTEGGSSFYYALFIGMMILGTVVSGFIPPVGSLTLTKMFSVTFFALLIVILAMCAMSIKIPPVPEEYAQREKEELARRKAAYAEFRKDLPIARAIVRKEYPKPAYKTAKRPIPGVTQALSDIKKHPPRKTEEGVEVRRGGEFIGNRMRFKVKVLNDSLYIITDVTVYLLSYPKDALKFAGEDHDSFFSKIEPGGFRSPTFDFLPTQDCVKGEIVAGVSYMDMRGQPHTLTAKPFVIRSVCDLLLPQQISPQDFQLKLKELECGELVIKIEEWTPEEMFEKSLRIVDESNFFEVGSKAEETDGVFFGSIVGFAKGKFTGKDVGVEITITGPTNVKGASCTIQVSGEDQAMILPAIDDLRERLSAWLCPMCSSPLTLANVEELRRGDVVQCLFCGVSIGR